jgi:general secretion pathway protein G
MMRRNTKLHNRQGGFSLVEIMIVIVLIGGIVALVANRVMNSKSRGDYQLAQVQLDTLAGKIDQYRSDTGRLPESLEQLVSSPGISGWLGPYAQAKELVDPFGNAIEYRRPGAIGPFELVSLGADGAPGGDSFDADIRKP